MNETEFRQLRQKIGLNQTQLANEWGVTDRTIRRWEAGDAPVSPIAAYTLRLMAKYAVRPSQRLSDAEVEAIMNAGFSNDVI